MVLFILCLVWYTQIDVESLSEVARVEAQWWKRWNRSMCTYHLRGKVLCMYDLSMLMDSFEGLKFARLVTPL